MHLQHNNCSKPFILRNNTSRTLSCERVPNLAMSSTSTTVSLSPRTLANAATTTVFPATPVTAPSRATPVVQSLLQGSPPTQPTARQGDNSAGARFNQWLASARFKTLLAVAGIAAAYTAVWQGYIAIKQGKSALALARWTARKDSPPKNVALRMLVPS